MKLKQILFVIVLLVIIFTGIILFSIKYIDPTDKSHIDSEAIKKLETKVKIAKFEPELESLKSELYRLQSLYPSDYESSVVKLDALGSLIEKIEKLRSESSKIENFKSTSTYKGILEIKETAFDEFTKRYESTLYNQVNEQLFWCKIGEAYKVVDDFSNTTPKIVLKESRVNEVNNNVKLSIENKKKKLEKVDEKIINFIQNSQDFVTAKPESKTDFSNKVRTWLSKYDQLAKDESVKDLTYLHSWVQNSLREIERKYFNTVDLSENEDQFEFALEFFPLSYQVLNFVEEDQPEEANFAEMNKLFFKILRLIRQDLLNLGVTNKYFVDSVESSEVYKILTITDYLVFFCQYLPDFYETDTLIKYVNSLFGCITEIFDFENLQNKQEFDKISNLNIAQSAYISVISKLESLLEFAWVKDAKDLISLKYKQLTEDIEQSLSKFNGNKNYSFDEATRLYANAVIYNSKDFIELLRGFFKISLKSEFDKIQGIESIEEQDVQYSKLFVTIDSLISVLNFFKSPEIQYVNSNITEFYKDELQRRVTTSLGSNKTIEALLLDIEKGVTLSFAGFATEFYNRILLQLKGEKEVTQELVNTNKTYFFTHYKTYVAFAEMLTNSQIVTVFDAMIFSMNFNRISKFTLIDNMLENSAIRRASLINRLQPKNSICLDIIENIITIKSLYTLSSQYMACSSEWKSWNDLGKIKSQLLSLKMKSSQNELVQSGLLMIDELLKIRFYEILTLSFDNHQDETWVARAKWLLRNFSLDSDKKNNIDEKIKILIK